MPNALLGSEVRVAGAGHVWAAGEGSALPTDLSTPPGVEFVDMGYVTTDGVTFTFSRESEDLDAWQGDKVRVLSSREPMTVGFALMQTNADALLLALGGGFFSQPVGGLYRYEPIAGTNLVRTLVIDFSDEGKNFRYIIPRAQVEGDVSFTLQRADALTYPITMGVLSNTPKYLILSDDDAMSDPTLPGGTPPAPGEPTASIGTAPTVGPVSGNEANGTIRVSSSTGDVFVVIAGSWVDSLVNLTPIPAAVGLTSDDPTVTPPLGTWADDDVVWYDDGGPEYLGYVRDTGAWVATPAYDVALS